MRKILNRMCKLLQLTCIMSLVTTSSIMNVSATGVVDIKGSIEITVKDKESEKGIEGVSFVAKDVFNKEEFETLKTNADGITTIDLPTGSYIVSQKDFLDNYETTREDYAVVVQDKEIKKISFVNQEKTLHVKVYTHDETDNNLPISTKFNVSSKDTEKEDTDEYKYSTDETGFSETIELLAGKYAVDVEIPDGYILNEETIEMLKNIDVNIDNSYPKPQVINIPFLKQSGNLKIIKVDGNDPTKRLDGAEFEVSNKEGYIETFTTNENGEIHVTNLKYGDYELRELKAPQNYLISTDTIEFTIVDDQEVVIEVENFMTQILTIKKIDSETEEVLSGAEFQILDTELNIVNNETYITDENGLIRVEGLESGDYTIVETKAPDNHLLAEDNNYPIIIESDKNMTITIKNDPKKPLLPQLGGYTGLTEWLLIVTSFFVLVGVMKKSFIKISQTINKK